MKNRMLTLMLVVVMLLSLAACSSGGNSASPANSENLTPESSTAVNNEDASPDPDNSSAGADTNIAKKKTPDDTLVYAMAFSGSAFDPCNSVSDWVTTIFITYETLVTYNSSTQQLEAALADKYEVIDASTIYFHLRDGVTFSGGEPLTGEDVLFSWKRCLSSVMSAGNAAYIDWDNCIIDGQDLTIKLVEPNAEFIYILCGTSFCVTSMNYINEHGEDYWKLNPCGTGPYVMTNFTEGESINYTRNDNYWGGQAKYKNVIIKPIIEEATRSITFESGDIDIARITTGDSIASLSGRESEGIYTAMTTGSTLYYINLYDESPLFSDTNLRLAFAYSIDWEALSQAIWGDYAQCAVTALSTASPDYTKIGTYPHDIGKAKEYLAAGGYPDGYTINMAVSSSGNDQYIAQIMQGYLAEAGIILNINVVDNAVAREMSASGEMELSIGQNTATVPSVAMIWSGQLAGSNSLLQEVHTSFLAGQQFQELFSKIIVETDTAAKTALVKEIQQLVHDECLWVPVAQVDNVWVYYDYVEGAAKMVENAGFSAGLNIRDLFFLG